MTYYGSLIVNFCAFFLPAFYATLSKLWVANIDKNQIATTDSYTYIQTIVEVLNEGLPRTAWLIIGDKSSRSLNQRLSLSYTMILFQVTMGSILTGLILIFAPQFASVFVPIEQRDTSLLYVRISSFGALSSSLEVAIAACTRALDRPNVPFWISSVKFAVNILLDMLFISKFHVFSMKPNVNSQALIRLVCDLSAALFGLCYFIYIVLKSNEVGRENDDSEMPRPKFSCLKVLAKPSVYTFIESAIRNAIYLFLISNIVSMGTDYATAWGVFNTIRWGLVMVPVQSLETSALTFVGHNFGRFCATTPNNERPKATNKDLLDVTKPALTSAGLAFVIELLMCLFMSLWGAKSFAYYLSESETVAAIVHQMWKSIDIFYILYGVGSQLGSILLATTPKWYLFQALISNLLWMLPWAIVVTQIKMTQENAWHYHSLIFGGALIVNFASVLSVCLLWAFMLKKGRITFPPISHEL